MFSATRIIRTASIGSLSPMAIAAGETPGALDKSLWQYDETTDTGYYGSVPASEFITGLELETLTGFTAGTDQNSDAGWLKFYVGPTAVCNSTPGIAKCLFLAKQNLKFTDVSWDDCNSFNLVFGNTSLVISGQSYKIRLILGGETSPGTGSEWNELMYRVHIGQPDTWDNLDVYEIGVDQASFCQEFVYDKNPSRGYSQDITRWFSYYTNKTGTFIGWRPALEYSAT